MPIYSIMSTLNDCTIFDVDCASMRRDHPNQYISQERIVHLRLWVGAAFETKKDHTYHHCISYVLPFVQLWNTNVLIQRTDWAIHRRSPLHRPYQHCNPHVERTTMGSRLHQYAVDLREKGYPSLTILSGCSFSASVDFADN